MGNENNWRDGAFQQRKEPDSRAELPEEESEAKGPLPLTPPDKPDMGCYVGLFGIFIAVFLSIFFFARIGAVFIVGVLALFLIAVATPMINPAERMSEKAKWRGRAITFAVLSMLLAGVAGYVWYRSSKAPVEDYQDE